MRKLIVLFAFAAVAAMAPTQAAAHHTPAHTQTQLNQTRAKLNALSGFVHNCLASNWVPIAWYGDPQGQQGDPEGYVYRVDDNEGLTTGLDIPDQGDAPTFVVAEVRRTPACLRRIAGRASLRMRATDRSSSLARKAFRFG
jgi:hypothetical protein